MRDGGDTAWVEVPTDRLGQAVAARKAVEDAVPGAGDRRVTLDLEGRRSGHLNADLALALGR